MGIYAIGIEVPKAFINITKAGYCVNHNSTDLIFKNGKNYFVARLTIHEFSNSNSLALISSFGSRAPGHEPRNGEAPPQLESKPK